MKFKTKDTNYAAVVVELKTFVPLANCDNVQGTLIFGNQVIVAKTSQIGDRGLFFPLETSLSKEFLGANNLFRKTEFGNVDASKKGFFEEHGRVKAVAFRGHRSEGFFIPLDSLSPLGFKPEDFNLGDEFNSIDGKEICKKYIPRGYRSHVKGPRVKGKEPKLEDQIVPGTFLFHYDTEQLRRHLDEIKPETLLSISLKFHGTSLVVGNLPTLRNLKWYERLAQRLGIKIQKTEYGLVVSSRRVIKSVGGESKTTAGFYSEDIWSIVGEEIKDRIPKGYTIYGEIVGYTPAGSPIQKGYAYGCPQGEHKLYVYRVVHRNEDGKALELSWPQMKAFCAKWGLEPVVETFYGRAIDFVMEYHPDDSKGIGFTTSNGKIEWDSNEPFEEAFLKTLEAEYLEQMCPYNRNEVPAEGVVVRIDQLEESKAFKLKSYLFLQKETKDLDSGEADIETQEAEVEP